MSVWQYTVLISDISAPYRPSINKVWEMRGVDGKTDWDRLQAMGAEGWEMVSSYPVAGPNGMSVNIVWVFKRLAPQTPQPEAQTQSPFQPLLP